MQDETKYEIGQILHYDVTDLNLELHQHSYKMYSTNEPPEYMIRVFENNIIPLAQLKFNTEAHMLKTMHNYDKIPTPRLIDLQFTDTGTAILVMEKLNGVPLHETWNYLELEQKLQLANDLGVMLNELHQINQSGFGHPGQYQDDWQDFIVHRLEENIAIMQQHLSAKTILKIRHQYPQWLTGLSFTTGVIIHADLNPHNILISSIEDTPVISGIIDWEWSIAGNPQYDLVEIESLFYNNSALLHSFYQGYGSIPHRSNWEKERKLYLLDKFLLSASYDVLTGNYTKQQQQLTRFMISTILK